ncbi:unnamed protein product [Mycetohabitans rhizoxinica HKI 454]|uniref:Uncharacterized protein n=1 Tax=Mycetohabitans rhizoxinica (strain DSM 19002 / CIP 109453 / HKI 454) TaxID=882378 RepID=E5ASL2_MYCRK|nr:unnamed protein product [Mycetohabitans rhizoxinica HKI 454]
MHAAARRGDRRDADEGRTGATMEAWDIARQWLSATDASRKLA